MLNLNQEVSQLSAVLHENRKTDLPTILETSQDEEAVEAGQDSRKTAVKIGGIQRFAIFAAIKIGKFRFQILEASDVREELVRSLKEKLQSGYNNEPIELQVQQKGLPFLNFEVSQLCTSLLSLPREALAPRTGVDVQLATITVRNFCLMNQEKVS